MFTYRLDERVSVRLYEESDVEELYAVTDANRDYLRAVDAVGRESDARWHT